MNVHRGTGEGSVSTGMVLDVCFRGVCGGSVDRGVIHPSTMLRPNGHKLPRSLVKNAQPLSVSKISVRI